MVHTDEVHTGQLLQSLDTAASCQTLADRATQDLEVSSLAETELELVVGLDLGELLNDSRVIDVDATETGKCLSGILVAVLLNQETRSFGQDDHSSDQNDGPGELNSDRDTVAAGIHAVLGGVVDNGSQKQTDGDGQLVSTDNGTTDPLGSGLRLVQRNWKNLCQTSLLDLSLGFCQLTSCREKTDTQTGEESASHKQRDGSRGCLQDNTKAENKSVENHANPTTEVIRNRGSTESTEESAGREKGDDHRGLGRGDIGEAVLRVNISSREHLAPFLHGQDTADGTGVISVKRNGQR